MKKIISLAIAAIITTVVSLPTFAAGVKAGYGKQLWKFNVISIPPQSNWEDSNASCNGARIFFEGSSGQIYWQFNPAATQNFNIEDCDGIDGPAVVEVDESLEVVVAVRILGPNHSTLNIACSEVFDAGADDNFCVVANTTIRKAGRTNFHDILSTVSDGAYEEYLWELSGDWKIFDVRVFAKN
jgi:hypothetical protein